MLVRGGGLAVLMAVLAIVVPASGQEAGKPAHDVLIDAPTILAPESRAAVRVVVYETKGIKQVAPIADAGVTVALVDAKSASRELWTGKTGAKGSADVAFAVPAVDNGDYTLVITTKSAAGEHVAKQPVKVRRDFKILLVTDKPLYQPGQLINLRALALDEMTMKALGEQELLFEVEDAKGNKVFKKKEKTNAYGVSAAEFQLADEVLMGDYKITATMAASKAEKSVTVKKYVLPKFKVEVKTDKKFYMPKETVKGTVQADYFFGKPVAGGNVVVKAATFDVQFREFAKAAVKTDEKGAATFEIVLPDYFVGSPLDKGNAFAQFEVEVLDTAEHLETVSKTVPVANQSILVGAVPESGKLVPGLENVIYVLASSPDGSPVEADVTLKIGTAEISGKTNPSGLAALKVTPDEKALQWNGETATVAAALSAKDKTGAKVERSVTLSSEFGKDQLLVRLDKAIYNVGDRIQLDAFGTFGGGDLYIDVVRRGQTVLGTVAAMEKGKSSVQIPLTADLFGTLEVHAYAFLGTGEIVRDTKVVFANPASELTIDVAADKPQYRPGEDAVVKFRVTDRSGAGVASALGVIVVDESVYALRDMQPGLEKVYFMLEKELLAPKVEIKWGGSIPNAIDAPVKEDETAQVRRQQAAIVLLAPVALPARHATVNTLAMRMQQFQGQTSAIYWGLYNYVVGQRQPFWQIGTGGKREFKKSLLDDLAGKGLLAKEQLKDPWGRAIVMDELGALSKAFSFEHWAKMGSQANLQHLWQGLWQWTLQNEALAYDATKKEWSWKAGVLDEMVKAKALTVEQTKDCFGEPIVLDKLGDDAAWKAENFAKIASNQKKQVIWGKVLEWVAARGGVTYDTAYAWDRDLLETMSKADAAFSKSVNRPEGGRYDLDALAKETPAFAPANVAKITSLTRLQVVHSAISAAVKKDGLAKVAAYDAQTKAWTFAAGLMDVLVKGGYLTETQSKDTAGRPFDLAALAKEDAQFAPARFLGATLRDAAGAIDGAICRTYHKGGKGLPEGDVITMLLDDEILKKETAVDPWGTTFKLVAAQRGQASSMKCSLLANKFALVSAGPDKAFGTADDITAASQAAVQSYRPTYAGCVFFQQQGVAYLQGGFEDAEMDDFNEAQGDPRRREGRGGGGGWGGRPPMAPGENAPRPAKDAGAFKGLEEKEKLQRQDKKADALAAEPAAGADEGGGAPVRVREYFPETLVWKPVLITGDDGRAELKFAMADSITTWRLTASANTADGRMGSTASGLLVFQDFFVDIDLPVALTQNDVVSVPVAVYNYLKEKQTVELRLEKDDWFELRDDDVKSIELGAGEVRVAYYRLRAAKLGAANKLTVHASGSKKTADAVRRTVEVVPDGQAVDAVFNGQLSGTMKHTFTVPAGSIDGASRLLFKAYPGVFASVMDGLEGMLRMPGG